MKNSFLRVVTLFAAIMTITCCTSSKTEVKSDPSTTLTVDYYEIRENSKGFGFSTPEEHYDAIHGETRPLIIIYSTTWCDACKVLKRAIDDRGWTDKVMIVDYDIPENWARGKLLGLDNVVPSLIYLEENNKTNLSGFRKILLFLMEKLD